MTEEVLTGFHLQLDAESEELNPERERGQTSRAGALLLLLLLLMGIMLMDSLLEISLSPHHSPSSGLDRTI